MNQATNIVREDFQQDFIDLRNACLAAHGIADVECHTATSRYLHVERDPPPQELVGVGVAPMVGVRRARNDVRVQLSR